MKQNPRSIDRLTGFAAHVAAVFGLHATETGRKGVVLVLVESRVELLQSSRGDAGRDLLLPEELGKELAIGLMKPSSQRRSCGRWRPTISLWIYGPC